MKKKGIIIVAIVLAIILITIISSIIWFFVEIKAPQKANTQDSQIKLEIKQKTSTVDILKELKENNVIKNEFAAKIYIKLYEVKNLQAGKYLFTGKENLKEVLNKLALGDVMDETIKITFKEGKNMRYIAQEIANNTNNTANDVFQLLENKEYILSLIDKYWFLSNDIQNEAIYYPLEGYLYPNTYTFENEDVEVKTIIEKMLDETGKILTKNKERMEKVNINPHQVLTVASIIEIEGNNAENRGKVSRVIYNRLNKNMSLGSDVTTYYAIKVDMGERDLYTKEIETYNAYNTRGPNMAGKLPIGPICNPSEESINAALHPTSGDFLYFVADKNGDMYFTNTYEEHQAQIAQLKRKGLWFEYNNE